MRASNWKSRLGALVATTLLAGISLPVFAATLTLPTVATYDDTSNANAVDANASGNALVSVVLNDYAEFKSSVATAFANDLGGVIQFDPSTDQTPTALAATFGTSGAKTLPITFSTSSMKIQAFSSSTVISGTRGIYTGTENANAFSFIFGGVTGGAANEAVTRTGLTILGRTGYIAGETFTMTATFSDNTIASLTSGTPNVSAVGTGDTFYGFTAPDGLSISKLTISFNGTGIPARTVLMDDLGFVTSVVPEPGTLALVALVATAGLARRSRRF